MRIVQVSPVLPVDVCTQAVALSRQGWLARLYTSTATNGRDPTGRLLGRWMGRRSIQVRSTELRSVVSSDCAERWRLLTGTSRIAAADARFRSVDLAASTEVGQPLDAVLCREDSACHTFRRARDEKVLCIYDLPTAHHAVTRKLMLSELERFPEFEGSFSISDEYSSERIHRKQQELDGADYILCPSQFVKRSLVVAGCRESDIHVLPFACDPGWLPRTPAKRASTVLCVGQVSARKGVHRLLRVWKRLGAHRTHRLTLIGDMRLPDNYINQFKGLYEHVGALPRQELAARYAAAKLLVCNAMSEGMALVVPEALSTATPVIASRNSGAEEIITDGEEGLLVPYGDDDALAGAIERLLSAPQLLAEMSSRAAETARARSWHDYAREFLTGLGTMVANAPGAAAHGASG